MPLVADGWETVWEAHWPINQCAEVDHGVHLMHRTGELFQCENCYQWFSEAEAPAFMEAAQHIAEILNDRYRQN